MGGIVGMWQPGGPPVLPHTLEAMADAIAYRGPDGRELHVDGALAIGGLLSRVTPSSQTERGVTAGGRSGVLLAWDGRLDDRGELTARLAGPIPQDATDPDLVVAAWEAWGEAGLTRLAGDFAFALFDPRAPELVLCRDRMGMRALAFARTPTGVVFASDVKGVLAHPDVRTEPNDELIAEIAMNGWPTRQRGETFFANVFDVVPAQVVRFTPAGAWRRTWWDFDRRAQLRLGSFEEYADALRELLDRAVRRRLRSSSPVAVSVSGGLDSTSIACLAERSGLAPSLTGVHYVGPAGSLADEEAIFAVVERALSMRVQKVPIVADGFAGPARDFARWGETPFPHPIGSVEQAALRAVAAEGARSLLSGVQGDLLVGADDYLRDLATGGRWLELARHLRELPRWNAEVQPGWFRRRLVSELARQLVPDALKPSLRRVRARFRDPTGDQPWWTQRMHELALRDAHVPLPGRRAFASASAMVILSDIRLKGRVASVTEMVRVNAAHGIELAMPFYDPEVVSFLAAIPGEVRCREGVHRALLREAMRGIIPDVVADRRWKADLVQVWNEAIARAAEPFAADPSAAEGVRRGYLRPEAIREAVGRLPSGTRWSVKLDRAIGLEAWLQEFFA